MIELTNMQIIKNSEGLPEYAVLPFQIHTALVGKKNDSTTIPHEVVGKIIMEGLSPVQAWRDHLGLTQAQIAERMGVTQAAAATDGGGKSQAFFRDRP